MRTPHRLVVLSFGVVGATCLLALVSAAMMRASQQTPVNAGLEVGRPPPPPPTAATLLQERGKATSGGILASKARLAHWDTEFYRWEAGIDKRESSSGVGSTLHNTRNTVQTLGQIIRSRNITSMVDLPCGDWNWMSKTITQFPHVKYTGMDLSPKLVARNAKKFPSYNFVVHDIVSNVLREKVDLVLNRDMLFHVPPAQGLQALRNMATSGSHYLLTTTFPEGTTNEDIPEVAADGGGIWYRINLNAPPFNLPPALSVHTESEGYGKSMGLWDLRVPLVRTALGLPVR